LVFAAQLGDPGRWLQAICAFTAYCLASSASYIFNDVADVDYDRAHTVKRKRPLATGDLAPARALPAAGVLASVALGLAVLLGPPSAGLMGAFLAMQFAYSLWLKHLVVVDLVVLAGLFVLRAAAGAIAIDAHLSPWLVACTALLAFFLGLAKRRAQIVVVGAGSMRGRYALKGYSLPVLDVLAGMAMVIAIGTYSVYTFVATSRIMTVTIPLVALGFARYAYLMRSRNAGEEPERTVVTDLPLLAIVTVWVVTSAIILMLQ